MDGGRGLRGLVQFEEDSERGRGLIVTLDFSGFQPSRTHAIHIHEYGDTTEGCKSLGGHWNPKNATHGSYLHPEQPRHVGDLINNIIIDQQGEFHYRYYDPYLRLRGKNSIYGRSVVVHEGEDDLGQGKNKESKKSGSAGSRMLCGIIAVRQN